MVSGSTPKDTATYQYEASQPPIMASTTGGVPGKGSFVPRRCTPQEIQEIPNVMELSKWASDHAMAPSIRDYVNLGAEDDESLAANRQGFSRVALRPRMLRDVSTVQTSTTILQGRVPLSFPLCVAPFAGCRQVHPDGELAICQAAAQAGIVYTVPNWAGTPVAEIVRETKAPLFFQIYPHKPTNTEEGLDRTHLSVLLHYLASLGPIVAVVITLDTANNSNREKTYKNKQWLQDLNDQVGGFPEPCCLPEKGVFPPVAEPGHSSSMTWNDVDWIQGQCQKHNLALILKGIMTKEDTQLAVQAGVDAIIVSNHGGRQLDGTLGTLDVVEECVRAAAGSSLEVFVDGGIRRGKDMVKCLALGAKCVLVGRPVLWGLAAGGQDGVARTLAILREEFETVLQLLGCQNPQELSPDHVQDRYGPRHRAADSLSREQVGVRWMMATVCIAVAAFALGRSSRTGSS